MKKLLQKIIPFDDLKETIFRFPLSILCALSLFIISISLVHELIDENEEWLTRVIAILGCCYLWFGISKLMAESQGWRISKYLVISFIVAGGITALLVLPTIWWMGLIFLLPALLLTLMVAPYLTGGDDISVWFFNRKTWFGVIISYAAILLFAGGLSIALGTVQVLFGVDIYEELFFYIWLFAALILGPVYALSWIPKSFEFSDDDCRDPSGLKFIVNWISVPIVFVYLLILYAYFIKIIVTGEMPNGYLAYMISGFAGIGIVTYLVAFPLRSEGSLQLKLFYKIFFPALLIPVGFHFYAIWERISAYGITEQRYLLLMSAIWFLLMAVSNSITRIPIRFIPASLAVLMILASFGPWGGVSVSGQSQTARLETLLTKYNLLVDGKITKTQEMIPFDDRKNISSILDYLCRSNRDDMIEPWFNIKDANNWKCSGGSSLTKQLGFEYVSKYKTSQRNGDLRFNITGKSDSYLFIGGYDELIKGANFYPYHLNDGKPWKHIWDLRNNQKVTMEYSKSILLISIDGYENIEINLHDLLNQGQLVQDDEREMIIESENKDIAYRIVLDGLAGQIKDGKPVINKARFDFLYRIKNK